MGVIISLWFTLAAHSGIAADAGQINKDSKAALQALYKRLPKAKELCGKALAVLAFPSVVKAGLGVGGQYGDRALIKSGKTFACYNTAGAQKYGYGLFFLNANALQQLDKRQRSLM